MLIATTMSSLMFTRAVSLSVTKFPHFLSNPIFFQTLRPYIHSPPPFTHTPDDAVSLFISMLHMRPTPPILQFNKILGSLVKTKQYATAISLSRQMEITPGEITPSIVTLSILMDCYCRVGQMTFAFSVFGKILKRGYQPDTITLNTLMNGLCINGEVEKALLFHDDVIAKGFHLNQVSYAILRDGLCRMGETRAALQLLRKIEGSLVRLA